MKYSSDIKTSIMNYVLKDKKAIEAKVVFMRVKPQNRRQLLAEIYTKLSNLSWVASLDSYLQESFKIRAEKTLEAIDEEIQKSSSLEGIDEITSNAAEYIVSVLANEAVVKELGYREIPLPEIFKHQKSQNPGFDFYAINANDVLLFGEAKFAAGTNAYGRALEQIVRFVDEKNDIADLADLVVLVRKEILDKVISGEKGYMGAFSSTNIETNKLVKNIQNNNHYNLAKSHSELVLIAVDFL